MKIAVMGSAGSSVNRAPFKDSKYDEWTQGKVSSIARAHDFVPGDWDIWGCSPGCWAVIPRATRWFELHRWETGVPWFSGEYCQFLRDFKGPVYTGGRVPEITNHVVYPIDRMEEKFSSYFMTSSLSLMVALAIDTIEQIRKARDSHREAKWDAQRETARIAAGAPEPDIGAMRVHHELPAGIDPAELEKDDSDDVIGLWGVDMAASDEYAYQRPGCQFFVLEAMRRGIGVYLPPESDLMRPMPVYGISEWDHSYIKLTSRARELSASIASAQAQLDGARMLVQGAQGEQHALNAFVSTWTSPYGMLAGMVIRQQPGTGLGSGITSFDGRPVERMALGAPSAPPAAPVLQAMAESPDAQLGREFVAVLQEQAGTSGKTEGAVECLRRIIDERSAAVLHASKAEAACRQLATAAKKAKPKAAHRRR